MFLTFRLSADVYISGKMFDHLTARYKFVFTIENRLCRDYITEKLGESVSMRIVLLFSVVAVTTSIILGNANRLILRSLYLPVNSQNLDYIHTIFLRLSLIEWFIRYGSSDNQTMAESPCFYPELRAQIFSVCRLVPGGLLTTVLHVFNFQLLRLLLLVT